MGCIDAWSTSDGECETAALYLVGMCADFVTTNPAIITARPSVATKLPIVPISDSSHDKSGPWTTISLSTRLTVPATYSSGISAGFTVPGSSCTTQLVTTITAPHVHFATPTVTVTFMTTTSLVRSKTAYRTGPVSE